MRKGLLGVLVLLMVAWAAGAQEASFGGSRGQKYTTIVAAGFAESSVAQVNLYAPGKEARSFAMATPAMPAAAEPAAGAYGLARGGSAGSLGATHWWVAGTCSRKQPTAAGPR